MNWPASKHCLLVRLTGLCYVFFFNLQVLRRLRFDKLESFVRLNTVLFVGITSLNAFRFLFVVCRSRRS